MGSVVSGGGGIRVGLSRVLGHPDFVFVRNAGGFPVVLPFQLPLGGIEHALVAVLFNGTQEGQRHVGALLLGHGKLAAGFFLESLAVIDHRVGNGVACQDFRHPVRFFLRFLLADGGGEEIGAHGNLRFCRLLKVIPTIGILLDQPIGASPVAHPDHGKVHLGVGHCRPVDGALIPGYVDADGGLVRFLGDPLFQRAACQKAYQRRRRQGQSHCLVEWNSLYHSLCFLC